MSLSDNFRNGLTLSKTMHRLAVILLYIQGIVSKYSVRHFLVSPRNKRKLQRRMSVIVHAFTSRSAFSGWF